MSQSGNTSGSSSILLGSKGIILSELPEHKPRLLLMGLKRYITVPNDPSRSGLNYYKRSGKSSISNVVFHKMPPGDTLFLETTTQIKKEAMQ